MSKTYIYSLIVIFLYILVINPLTSDKEETSSKSSSGSSKKSLDESMEELPGVEDSIITDHDINNNDILNGGMIPSNHVTSSGNYTL